MNIFVFFYAFLMFGTCEIDSNHMNALVYDEKNIHEENHHNIYFRDLNVYELPNILKNVNMEILSYQIDDEKYYVSNNNINEIMEKYTQNMNIEDKLYNKIHGFNIQSISVICQTSELIKLENITSVF